MWNDDKFFPKIIVIIIIGVTILKLITKNILLGTPDGYLNLLLYGFRSKQPV